MSARLAFRSSAEAESGGVNRTKVFHVKHFGTIGGPKPYKALDKSFFLQSCQIDQNFAATPGGQLWRHTSRFVAGGG